MISESRLDTNRFGYRVNVHRLNARKNHNKKNRNEPSRQEILPNFYANDTDYDPPLQPCISYSSFVRYPNGRKFNYT